MPAIGCVASSAAFELMKNSVPFSPTSSETSAETEGQTVKPGCFGPASLGTLTAFHVSMRVTLTEAGPEASWRLENA